MRILEAKKIIDQNKRNLNIDTQVIGTNEVRVLNVAKLQSSFKRLLKFVVLDESDCKKILQMPIDESGHSIVTMRYFNLIKPTIDNIIKQIETIEYFTSSLNIQSQEENYINFSLPKGIELKENLHHINKFQEQFNLLFASQQMELKFKRVESGSDWLVYVVDAGKTVVDGGLQNIGTVIVTLIASQVRDMVIKKKGKQTYLEDLEIKECKDTIIKKYTEKKIEESADSTLSFLEENGIDIRKGTTEKDTSKKTHVKQVIIAMYEIYENNIEVEPSLNPPKYIKDNTPDLEEFKKIMEEKKKEIEKEEQKAIE